jgi:hypothetical protein
MKYRFLIALLLVGAMLVGCGSGPKATQPPQSREESTKAPVAPTVNPTTKAALPTNPAVQPTASTDEYNFGDASDLSNLTSYRAHYVMKWDSTKDGTRKTGSWDLVEEFVKDPPARRTLWTSTDDGKESTVELIQIGQNTYMKTGDEWLAMTSTDQDIFAGNAFLSDPMGMVQSNKGRLAQRGVSVNGVSTDRYTFDEATLGGALTLGAISKAKGDVWLAPALKVVIKYAVHYEGKDLILGGGGEGYFDVALDLTDVNKPIAIKPPEGVGPAMPEDIPVMDGATELTAVSGIVSYKTTSSVDEVRDFYEAQMRVKGWAKAENQIEGMLMFTKGSRQATVMYQEEDGKTSVTVMTQQ